MALKRTINPAELPITMDEAKAHLRVTDSAEDADIASYLRAVVSQLDGPEGILNRALITQTLEMTLDGFPSCPIDLPLAPMQSVSSITYLGSDGVIQTLVAENYRVLNANTPTKKGRIELAYGYSWPSVRNVSQSVAVTWVAGYGARNDVPEYIRHLILFMVKSGYDVRDPYTSSTLFENPAMAGLLNQATYPVVA